MKLICCVIREIFYKTLRMYSLLWCNLWLLKFLTEKKCISLRQRLSEVGVKNGAWALKQLETLLSDCCNADLAVVLMFTVYSGSKRFAENAKGELHALKWARFSLASQSAHLGHLREHHWSFGKRLFSCCCWGSRFN